MDLSKAYDCFSHELLIAKMHTYGLGQKSLSLIYSYLTQRKHRVKITSYFSVWLETVLAVPQGSILGPLLFNIFLDDLFMFIQETDICNFADDNTIYYCDMDFENVLRHLKADLRIILERFENNSLCVNPSKFQLIFLSINNP